MKFANSLNATYLIPTSFKSLSVSVKNIGKSTSCSSNTFKYFDNPNSFRSDARSFGWVSWLLSAFCFAVCCSEAAVCLFGAATCLESSTWLLLTAAAPGWGVAAPPEATLDPGSFKLESGVRLPIWGNWPRPFPCKPGKVNLSLLLSGEGRGGNKAFVLLCWGFCGYFVVGPVACGGSALKPGGGRAGPLCWSDSPISKKKF